MRAELDHTLVTDYWIYCTACDDQKAIYGAAARMNRKKKISNGVVCECETGLFFLSKPNNQGKTIPYLRKQNGGLPISESVVVSYGNEMKTSQVPPASNPI